MARQRRFKCSRCDREFSMAAHLARHMNTLHASNKVKATKRASVAAPANPGSESDLAGVLGSLEAHRDRLANQKNEIDDQMRAIGVALAALGAGAAEPVVVRRRQGKGTRAGSLKDYIARVLRGRSKGLSVTNIRAAVLKAGYKSKDKRLNHAVGKVLADMKNVARVDRGVYRLK